MKWKPYLNGLICPLLTIIQFYYLTTVDHDGNYATIVNTLVTGLSCNFFTVVMFSEIWILSTLVYAPLITYWLYKTSEDLEDSSVFELIFRSIFLTIVYQSVAYRVEILSKQSFLGRESHDNAFHRLLKIFDTFPDGIAMMRNGYFFYGNSALTRLLDLDQIENLKHSSGFPSMREHRQLKNALQETRVKLISKRDKEAKNITVWNFLDKNSKPGTFELLSREGTQAVDGDT